MSDTRAIAQMLANQAAALVPAIVRDDEFPATMSTQAATAAVSAIVMQSPVWQSRRVLAVVFAAITAVFAVPEVQAWLGPWAAVITAALSAALAGWSKAGDPRPTR